MLVICGDFAVQYVISPELVTCPEEKERVLLNEAPSAEKGFKMPSRESLAPLPCSGSCVP